MENVGSRSLDANLQNPTSADLENVGSRSLDANLQNPTPDLENVGSRSLDANLQNPTPDLENVGSRSLDANLRNPTSADLENVGSRSLDANLQNLKNDGFITIMTNFDVETEQEWWSQQWLDLLDKYRFKKRLERARNYARQGNVLSIDFQDEKVQAKVQGTQPEPYEVSLWLDQFSDEEWNFVTETLSQRAIFSAKLLAGEMPQNIEEVFATNGLRLFPFSLDDVHAHCTCPDKANPCKHIGAVYYMLGDRFSEDPFVLFKLRGRTQEKIIANLRQLRSQTQAETETKPQVLPETKTVNYYPPQVEEFWNYNEQLDPSLVVIAPPSTSDNVLNVLGTIPLESAGNQGASRSISASETVMKYLDTIYKNVSQRGILMALSRDEESP
jgi:uncharacterized Zn finger protein